MLLLSSCTLFTFTTVNSQAANSLIPEYTQLGQAIKTGDALLVDDADRVLKAIIDDIDEHERNYFNDKNQLFNLTSDALEQDDGSSLTDITWFPSGGAIAFTPTFGKNEAVLLSNASFTSGKTVYEKAMAVIGKTEQARYMLLASNPMNSARRGNAINDEFWGFYKNSIHWLTGKTNAEILVQGLNVTIAHHRENYYFRDASLVRAWLAETYGGSVTYNEYQSCNAAALRSCLSAETDLLIISANVETSDDVVRIAEDVKWAQAQGIPVLYTHVTQYETDLSKALFSRVFDVAYASSNAKKHLGMKGFDITQYVDLLPETAQSQWLLANSFLNGFSFEVNQCPDNASVCKLDAYTAEFKTATSAIKNLVDGLDSKKINIFSTAAPDYQKLFVLLADLYRQDVSFPMDYRTINTKSLLASFYADHVVHSYRDINPVQPDMGTFSRSDFSHVVATTKTVDLVSRNNFKAAGVYALPGQTFTVTRLDDKPEASTHVYINSLRSSATRVFSQSRLYNRPKYLSSTKIPLKVGETITITSPYGGPIQIAFGNTNDIDVKLEFNNVGLHPYWASEADTNDFTLAMEKNDYDWAEVSTPSFEIHSTHNKMLSSLANKNWLSVEAFADATMQYVHNYPHVLAGFQGVGIDIVPEIHQFAAQHNWTVKPIDMMKHANLDQSTCGSGCSGNPYDANWSFNPVGHGDLHELGHGLENNRLKLGNYTSHATTNFYSYFSKHNYYLETGNAPSCQNLPFESLFNRLQESKLTEDPRSYMQGKLSGFGTSHAIYMQIMMHAQASGSLKDGWNLYARMHIFEREYQAAIKNNDIWELKRADLGMSHFSRDEVKSLGQDARLAIAISFVTSLDYTDYIQMWGFTVEPAAIEQVKSFNFTVVSDNEYFKLDGNQFCYSLDWPKIPLNGYTRWDGSNSKITYNPTNGQIFQLDTVDAVNGNVPAELPLPEDISWVLDNDTSFAVDLYFGSTHESLVQANKLSSEFKGNYTGEGHYVFSDGELSRGESTYYWRLDTYIDGIYQKGNIQEFYLNSIFESGTPKPIVGAYNDTLAVSSVKQTYPVASALCKYHSMQLLDRNDFAIYNEMESDPLSHGLQEGRYWAASDHLSDNYWGYYRYFGKSGGKMYMQKYANNVVCKTR